jgi:uncharacterized protein (DUF3084 family)
MFTLIDGYSVKETRKAARAEADKKWQIAIADKDAVIADKDAAIADKDAQIAALLARLDKNNP